MTSKAAQQQNSASDALYVLRGGEAWRSPWAAYRRLRDEAPVYKVERHDAPDYWVLSRFDDVFDAARDAATYSSAQGLTPDADAIAMFGDDAAPIVMMDPPDHTAMRRLISRQLTPRRVAGIEADVRAFVDERLAIREPGLAFLQLSLDSRHDPFSDLEASV